MSNSSMAAVEVRKSPLGGLGVFALRSFVPGEEVLCEAPFLKVRDLQWENMECADNPNSQSSKKIISGRADIATVFLRSLFLE